MKIMVAVLDVWTDHVERQSTNDGYQGSGGGPTNETEGIPDEVERLRRNPSPPNRYIRNSQMNPVIVLDRAEASKEVYLSALGLTGTWITRSDRVKEEEDNEEGPRDKSESDLHLDSTESTIVLDPEDENDTLPKNVLVSSADESYDAQRILENMYPPSDDETSGWHMVNGVVVVEEDDEESHDIVITVYKKLENIYMIKLLLNSS